MTYQGAIDELKSLENNESMPDWFKPTLKKVRETMEMDGRENVEGEWIPVSERLPEIFRFVNCTCHSLIDDREDWVVETVYVPQPSNSPYSDWGNIPMLNNKECEVIAWMYREIPEPYKKGGE